MEAQLKVAQEAIHQASSGTIYDEIIANDDLQSAFQKLESYIFQGSIIRVEGAQDEIKEELKTEDVSTPVARNDVAMDVDEKVGTEPSEALQPQDSAPATAIESEELQT